MRTLLILTVALLGACTDTTAPLPVFGDVDVQAIVWDASPVPCTVHVLVSAVGGRATIELFSYYGAAAGAATTPAEVAVFFGSDTVNVGAPTYTLLSFPDTTGDLTFVIRAAGHRPHYAFVTCQ